MNIVKLKKILKCNQAFVNICVEIVVHYICSVIGFVQFMKGSNVLSTMCGLKASKVS